MYDAIVVGARCAGAPTAMLLAQKGYSVVMVDRAAFPSDTVSTHIVKYPGVRQLENWGLLTDVLETGCPPIDRALVHSGDFPLAGSPPPKDDVSMLAPRRTVLDNILVDAALDAGATLRDRFVVRDLCTDGGQVTGIEGQQDGDSMETLCGRLVIGADGMNSFVARAVDAPRYNEVAPQAFYHYNYWHDLPVEALETHWRHHTFVLGIPTNDGLTCLAVGRPIESLREFSADIESSYHAALDIAPHLADAVDGAEPVERFVGTAVPNYHRKPYGPGWALVGDAGLCMDPLLGHGISDAFCDAQRLAEAIDAGFSGERLLQSVLAAYEQERNERKVPWYDINWTLSRLEGWDRPEQRRLREALRNNPEQADRWAGVNAYSVGYNEFYSSEFVRQAMAESTAGQQST